MFVTALIFICFSFFPSLEGRKMKTFHSSLSNDRLLLLALPVILINLFSSKSWQMSLQNISQWFLISLGNLDTSELTGTWWTSSLFLSRARRRTLEMTGLSISLQCWVKLQRRLFWEVFKNTWKIIGYWSRPAQLLERKVLLVKPDIFLW